MAIFLGLISVLSLSFAANHSETPSPEERAIAFLAQEVPRWAAENKCYSCHNNGDAARTLFQARRLSYTIPADALTDTLQWLARPNDWDHNHGDERFSDKKLARVQFASALADAVEVGQIKDKKHLARAAEILALDQSKDGAWRSAADGSLGSPVTYGTCLTTYQARRVLERADAERYRSAIARADDWFLSIRTVTTPDTAAVLLALEGRTGEAGAERRRQGLAFLKKGQGKDGGWGPYLSSPSEPFDTALAVLALTKMRENDVHEMLHRGRAYLLDTQRKDGSWPETTRPAGAESYAQRISTTGWATLALLATRPGHGKK